MASIGVRNNKLLIDFRYCGVRCREQTELDNTPANVRKLNKLINNIDTDMRLECFVYRDYFPGSTKAAQFSRKDDEAAKRKAETMANYQPSIAKVPEVLFAEFSKEWFDENAVRWKNSYTQTISFIIKSYLNTEFGDVPLNLITKAAILKFRARIANTQEDGKKRSADFVNHVMTPLRMILAEAGDRYGFRSPFENIKPLRVDKTDVEPFSLEEVKLILEEIRADFHAYFTVRFFTGMRTSECDGLKWKYVDFQRELILIRETNVNGVIETTKTVGSYREIKMSSLVFQALKQQFATTSNKSEFVFCTNKGTPLDHRNVRDRIWKPLLEKLGLTYRRPYQTRHTAATLWLAAGESPEWIARQMGHTTTKMLFETYSRYVPNLTRQDGSAFERLLNNNL
ncbi:tyrosine-type recombinase/integrase [Alishewanella sp. HL-SH05]|uniref:tyrosine-type recombinase/integrase n=1 Tax=Alishewanella sp. HL-SH05 TaxID=3461145 RepID=UPI004042A615